MGATATRLGIDLEGTGFAVRKPAALRLPTALNYKMAASKTETLPLAKEASALLAIGLSAALTLAVVLIKRARSQQKALSQANRRRSHRVQLRVSIFVYGWTHGEPFAAHATDLQNARQNGLRTAFVYRPNEFGDGAVSKSDRAQPGDFDIVATSMIDFATQMGT